MTRIVADLGNSRLKWAELDSSARDHASTRTPANDAQAWSRAFQDQDLAGSDWAVSSVNPPACAELEKLLRHSSVARVRWYLRGTDVNLPTLNLENDLAGADRALGVVAAIQLMPERGVRFVVACGTGLVVELINADDVWAGGAIAPGIGLLLDSLRAGTAQLPRINLGDLADPPPACGVTTLDCIRAGVIYGTAGAVRELVARQAAEVGASADRPILWTGGDAERIAPLVSGPNARIVPDLVLLGLAHAAFQADLRPGHA